MRVKQDQEKPAAALAAKREALALAAAKHAAFDGWTATALAAGGRDLGIGAGEADLLFPAGIPDWINAFEDAVTRHMQRRIAGETGFAGKKIREKIAFAVRARLEILTPYKESVRRLDLALLFPPSRIMLALKLLHLTTDAIWRAAGDASTDFNYYTKRGLLAGVYAATQLFWLNDTSAGHKDSWAFLDRRIGNVLTIGQAIGRFKKAG